MIIFLDYNRNGRLDGRDRIITHVNGTAATGTLTWRAFQNRRFLQFSAHGYTHYQNGNLTYCPADNNLAYARQIVVNVQGRVRGVHSRNEDGLPTDRNGRILRCE